MRRSIRFVFAFAIAGAGSFAWPVKAGFNIDDQGPGVGDDYNAATWSADVPGSGPSTWQGLSGWQGGGYDQGGYGPRPYPRPRPWGPPAGETVERERSGPDFGDGRGAADWGGAPHYVNPTNGTEWETGGWRGGERSEAHWHGGQGFAGEGPGGPGGLGGPGNPGRPGGPGGPGGSGGPGGPGGRGGHGRWR